MPTAPVAREAAAILSRPGVASGRYTGGAMASFLPVTGEEITRLPGMPLGNAVI